MHHETLSKQSTLSTTDMCRVTPGSDLLLQDRGGPGRGRHPGGSTGRHHDLPGAGHAPHGQEERHRAQPAVRGDPRLHLSHLLRQDRHSHHQPDVRLQGEWMGREALIANERLVCRVSVDEESANQM